MAAALLGGCAPPAAERQERWTEAHSGIEFVRVPAGSFVMGSPRSEPLREEQETPHRVEISRPFFLGRTEVTQAQWRTVMEDRPSLYAECGPDCPVETVNLVRIHEFLERLKAISGERLRLPTEAEWEYACRAGSSTAFGVGDTLSSIEANFDGREPYPGAEVGPYLSAPAPVASYAANAWGLFDMSGNVWEWVEDEHCPYPDERVVDPLARCGSPLRVIRGGSWYYGPDSARCALRYTHRAVDDGPSLGFRLVREEPLP